MRVLAVLTAIIFKFWFVARMMTPRDVVILKIAAFALLVVALTIMGAREHEPKSIGEPFCNYPTPPHIDYPDCQFKLRDARSGHAAYLAFGVKLPVSIAASPLHPILSRFNTMA